MTDPEARGPDAGGAPVTLRTVTLAVDIRRCGGPDLDVFRADLERHLGAAFQNLQRARARVAQSLGVSFATARLAVSPVATLHPEWGPDEYVAVARILDETATALGAEFIGGFAANVAGGTSDPQAQALIAALPDALRATRRLCGFLNVAGTDEGTSLAAVAAAADVLTRLAGEPAAGPDVFARFAVSCNGRAEVPFMPLAYHGGSGADAVVNIGVGGIERIVAAVEQLPPAAPVEEVCRTVRDVVAAAAQRAEGAGAAIAAAVGAKLGSIDVSLLPMPVGRSHSLLHLFRLIGVESFDAPGALAVLAMLTDAVRKGGQASERMRGLSGTLLSISEDSEAYQQLCKRPLSLDRLLALSTVCSVGLDMIAVPSDTPAAALAGVIADEVAIGCVHRKTTAVRLILAPADRPDVAFESKGVFGRTRVLAVPEGDNAVFLRRPGSIPPPMPLN